MHGTAARNPVSREARAGQHQKSIGPPRITLDRSMCHSSERLMLTVRTVQWSARIVSVANALPKPTGGGSMAD